MRSGLGMLRLPDEVRFAWGAVAGAVDIIRHRARRVLVVSDPVLAATAPFESLMRELRSAGVEVEIQTDVPAELPVDAIMRLADAAHSYKPDLVIGYGGGSAIDAAKLTALLHRHGGTLSDYYGENRVPGPIVPLIAIPTTAGTGSEVTPVAVVTDPDRDLKGLITIQGVAVV